MHRKVTTIRDVARQAGVSISTVSHILNGNDWPVSSAVRQRVLEVVAQLNYRPNAIARSMVKRKTAIIGLVINDVENPLFVSVVGAVNEVLQPAGYHMVLASAPDLQSEIEAIETLRAQQVDGFIFMVLSFSYPSDHLVRLEEDGVPFVVINRYVEDENVNQILFDDWGAAYIATNRLIDLGHTHIGVLSGPLHNDPPRRSALERHQGWQQALTERQLTVRPEWIFESDYTSEGGYHAVQRFLVQQEEKKVARPTALLAANDMMALGALKALQQARVRVPQEMALLSLGDPPFAAYTVPALTTYALPTLEAGRLAAHMLLDWFKEGKPIPAQRVTLAFTLRVRESCGAHLSLSGEEYRL